MIKDIVVCDLDGTLADITHRRHFVERSISVHPITPWKPNWDAFHAACVDDRLISTTAITVKIITTHFMYCRSLWIVSGRSDAVRPQTEAWLSENGIVYERLIMRKSGDYTPDSTLKRSWLTSGVIPKERIFCVFDDRDRVVDMWRDEGLMCYQVARGDF